MQPVNHRSAQILPLSLPPGSYKRPISTTVTGTGGDLAANRGDVLFHQEFLPEADQVRGEGGRGGHRREQGGGARSKKSKSAAVVAAAVAAA